MENGSLFIPPKEAISASPKSTQYILRKEEWQIQITASKDTYRDEQNYAGVRRQADDDWDVLDLAEPPPIGDFLSLYFNHLDWTKGKGKYAGDFRTTGKNGYVFDFTVESNFEGTTVITFRPQNLPPGFDWAVLSLDTKTQLLSQTILTSSRKQIFRLLVGNRAFLGKQLAEHQTIPQEFRLHQNYPNPFNSTTRIRFDLPRACLVKIDIFDLNGQMLKTILRKSFLQVFTQSCSRGIDWPVGSIFIALQQGIFVKSKK